MNVVQGKPTNKNVILAQEIAFAKVLAGNDKTLRDRALKKLKKWLTVRGTGKWVFTEEEFIRIWTGLFYCMWMSDKFLVQEELAENISQLVHCFRKNSKSALLFIKCFNKRLLMEYEGLDQYRIDKFNMLIRRFLRQTFEYCKRTNWEKTILYQLKNIFSEVVFQEDSALGYILHLLNIYAEELAKVSRGKVEKKIILEFLEPIIALLSKSKDERIQNAVVEFFDYLMAQTDSGIEFEEKFKAWKQLGFPGRSINSMKKVPRKNGIKNGWSDRESDDDYENDDQELDDSDRPLDPRAGNIHVDLPQIPLDIDGLINLFRKHEKAKYTTIKGKKTLRALIQKFSVIKRGRFPAKFKKDPILDEKPKSGLSYKHAKALLEFTKEIDSGPIKTEEFLEVSNQLEQNDEITRHEDEEECEMGEMNDEQIENEMENGSDRESESEIPEEDVNEKFTKTVSSKKAKKNIDIKKKKKNHNREKKCEKKKKDDDGEKSVLPSQSKNKKIIGENGVDPEKSVMPSKQKEKIIRKEVRRETTTKKINNEESNAANSSINKNGAKRKILSNWQVQDIDESSPEYNSLKPQKIIKLEVRRLSHTIENEEPVKKQEISENAVKKELFTPAFWENDKAKVFKKVRKSKGTRISLNSFAENGASPGGSRRISFALDKNMAQENEEYLEEVKNSPRVPFDGSKKPSQSALKSGLPPSPINPFYRFKKIKF